MDTREQSVQNTVDSYKKYVLDVHQKGITFAPADGSASALLTLPNDTECLSNRSRYESQNAPTAHQQLERYLMRLSSQGVLGASHISFGNFSDPFHPFEDSFDQSIKLLELFKRYQPGMLTVQTRSPLIVIALPVFAALKEKVSVTIGIETPDESQARCFTPQLPQVTERLKTATALRRFGIEVNAQVAPLLPYGDWKADATGFAELLKTHFDFIKVAPLSDGSEEAERLLRNSLIAKKLADARLFQWLRPDAAEPLRSALRSQAAHKLRWPTRRQFENRQLSLFAA